MKTAFNYRSFSLTRYTHLQENIVESFTLEKHTFVHDVASQKIWMIEKKERLKIRERGISQFS